MPARKPWSSSSPPSARPRKAGDCRRAATTAASSAGSSTSGPRPCKKGCDSTSSLRHIDTSEAEYSRIAQRAVSSATRSERFVAGRSPAAATFHTPYSWLWLYIVQPWSKRVSMALPRAVIDSMRWPTSSRSKRFSSANANSTRTSGSPTTAAARQSAARRISGPSGMPSDRGHASAVHRKADAVDVGRGRRTQESDDPAGLIGGGEAARRDRGLHVAADVVLAAASLARALAVALADAPGFGQAGQHVVDGDALGRELARQGLGPGGHRAADRVGHARARDRFAYRGGDDVDDAAPARLAHAWQHRLQQ